MSLSPFEENEDPALCGHPFVRSALPENVTLLPGAKPSFYECLGCKSVLNRNLWEACVVGDYDKIGLGILG